VAFGVVVSVNAWLNLAGGGDFALGDLEVSGIGDRVKLELHERILLISSEHVR
jgi:hypothetical protein